MVTHMEALASDFASQMKSEFPSNKDGIVELTSINCTLANSLNVEFKSKTENEILDSLKAFKSLHKTEIKSFVYANSPTLSSPGNDLDVTGNISLNHSIVVKSLNDDHTTADMSRKTRSSFSEHNFLNKKDCQKVLFCISLIANGSVDYPLNHILPIAIFSEGNEVIFITQDTNQEEIKHSNRIGLLHYKIKLSGMVEIKQDVPVNQRFVENFQNHHKLKYKTGFSTQCEGSYKLLQSENVHGCEAIITCNKVKSVLEIDKQNIVELKLLVTPNVTSPDSIAHRLYEEIELVQGFADYFEVGKIQWQDEVDILNSALTNLDGMLKGNMQRKSEIVEDEKGISKLSALINRTEYDFTECVWQVLQKVNSMHELVACWKAIFQKLSQKGESMVFWLHPNNKTTLAELVRKSYKGEGSQFPTLDRDKPVELLVEIGLEKLTNDYIHYFKKQRLATETKLMQFANKAETFEQRLVKLRKLQYATELSLLCKQHFNLQYNQLYYKIQNFLESEDLSPTTSFKVDYEIIEAKIEKLMPYKWVWSIQSKVKGSQVESVCCFLNKNPLSRSDDDGENCELNDSDFDTADFHDSFDDISKYYVFTGSTMIL